MDSATELNVRSSIERKMRALVSSKMTLAGYLTEARSDYGAVRGGRRTLVRFQGLLPHLITPSLMESDYSGDNKTAKMVVCPMP